jgi:hypothetical protein
VDVRYVGQPQQNLSNNIGPASLSGEPRQYPMPSLIMFFTLHGWMLIMVLSYPQFRILWFSWLHNTFSSISWSVTFYLLFISVVSISGFIQISSFDWNIKIGTVLWVEDTSLQRHLPWIPRVWNWNFMIFLERAIMEITFFNLE